MSGPGVVEIAKDGQEDAFQAGLVDEAANGPAAPEHFYKDVFEGLVVRTRLRCSGGRWKQVRSSSMSRARQATASGEYPALSGVSFSKEKVKREETPRRLL
ncbi:MAG: hypothetical protein N2512_12705 [Armatimonadetes bacterium]|nr:hypothetical protein [Armatimonadota bacterium]